MIFETVAQLKLATLTAGQLVSTKGYYASGDGGAADYIVAATQAVDGYGDHTLAGGTVALLQGDTANVKQYGAKGDGTGSDQVFIQAAVAAKSDVFLPNGVYNLTATIALPSNSSLTGQSRDNTVLFHDLATSKFDLVNNSDIVGGNTNIQVKSLWFKGNGTTVGWSVGDGAGVRFETCTHVKVLDCKFLENSSYGIECIDTYDFTLDGNYLERCGDDGVSISSTGLGVAGGRGIITNNHAYGMNADVGTGTGTGFEVDDGPRELIITNNIATNCLTGIDLHTHVGESDPGQVIISNNICRDGTVGIRVYWFGGENNPNNTIVSNNTCSGNAEYGIAAVSGDELVITGNLISENGGTGIFINQGGGATKNEMLNLTISNNMCRQNYRGISVGSTSHSTFAKRVIIADNNVYFSQREAILVDYVQNVNITGNIVSSNSQEADDTYANIRLTDAVDRALIAHNQILWGGAANRVKYGISVELTSVNIWIRDNYIDAARTSIISSSGTGGNRIISENIGYVTENNGIATLLNGTTSLVVAHGLDLAPTIVNIAWRENPTNPIGDWWVSAIDATNFTLNSVDPGASNLNFGWETKVR